MRSRFDARSASCFVVLTGILQTYDCVPILCFDMFAKTAKGASQLASKSLLLSELAVLPCTPEAHAEEHWKEAQVVPRCVWRFVVSSTLCFVLLFTRRCAVQIACTRALDLEPDNEEVLTQCAHLQLRRALFLQERGVRRCPPCCTCDHLSVLTPIQDLVSAQRVFSEAVLQYTNLVQRIPIRQVVKFLVLAKTGAPAVSYNHFFGFHPNGYSEVCVLACLFVCACAL
jgi:hypothetical protein